MKMLTLFIIVSLNHNPAKEPHIVTQHAEKNGSMTLYVHNPLNKAIWTWYECENVISVHPVGVPARSYSEIHLKSNDPDVPVEDNACYISKWQVQKNGN